MVAGGQYNDRFAASVKKSVSQYPTGCPSQSLRDAPAVCFANRDHCRSHTPVAFGDSPLTQGAMGADRQKIGESISNGLSSSSTTGGGSSGGGTAGSERGKASVSPSVTQANTSK